MCIEEQFWPSAKVATSLLGLIPSVLCSRNVNLNVAVKTYNDDLLSPKLFEMELTRWRSQYSAMEPQLRPASPAVPIKEGDAALFPNISILLQIACSIPVTSCECERSTSTLRRLTNYMCIDGKRSLVPSCAFAHSIHYSCGLGHCSRLLCSATPPSTSTGKSSAITVSLTLKVRFKQEKNPPRQKPAYGPDSNAISSFTSQPVDNWSDSVTASHRFSSYEGARALKTSDTASTAFLVCSSLAA